MENKKYFLCMSGRDLSPVMLELYQNANELLNNFDFENGSPFEIEMTVKRNSVEFLKNQVESMALTSFNDSKPNDHVNLCNAQYHMVDVENPEEVKLIISVLPYKA